MAMSASTAERLDPTIERRVDTVASLVGAPKAGNVPLSLIRFANRADAAIVTAHQFRISDRGELSMSSDSSIQSFAASLACSGPCEALTAAMNADNSRSAKCIWSVYNESENDSLCIVISSFPLD
jgi:hypothetical protein